MKPDGKPGGTARTSEGTGDAEQEGRWSTTGVTTRSNLSYGKDQRYSKKAHMSSIQSGNGKPSQEKMCCFLNQMNHSGGAGIKELKDSQGTR